MEEYEETETCVKCVTPQTGTNKMITESGMKSTPSSTRKGPPSRLIIENSSMQSSVPVKSASKDSAIPKTVDNEDSVKRNILIQKYRSRFLNTLIKDCQNRGLQCSGTKMDLVDRLVDDDLRKLGSGKGDSTKDIRHPNTTLKHVDKCVSITQVVSRLGYTALPSEPLSVVPSMKERLKQFEKEVPLPPPLSTTVTPVKPRVQPISGGSTESRIQQQPFSPEASSLHTPKLSPPATAPPVGSAVSPIPPHNKGLTSINSPLVASTSTTHRVSPPAHTPVSTRVPTPPVSPPVQLVTAHSPATVQIAESSTVDNTEDGDDSLF